MDPTINHKADYDSGNDLTTYQVLSTCVLYSSDCK